MGDVDPVVHRFRVPERGIGTSASSDVEEDVGKEFGREDRDGCEGVHFGVDGTYALVVVCLSLSQCFKACASVS